MDDETPWFTVEWLSELTRLVPHYEIGYAEVAELMAKYQQVNDIRVHMAVIAGTLPRDADVFMSRPTPPEVAEAIRQIAELNEWALLSAVEGAELPSGPAASRLVRDAFDRTTATFTFVRQ